MKRLLLALTLTLAAPALPAFAAPPAAPFLIAEYDAAVEESLAEGRAAMEEGNYEQALSSFQDAASTYPDDKALQALVAEAQTKACEEYVKEGRALIAQKAYADAINAFDSALDILPESETAKKGKQLAENWPKADNYIKEAKARLAKREYDHAVAYFQKAYDLTHDAEVKKWLDDAKKRK
jgi:tetratricopeptide (TPR) repeat protein